MGTLTPIEITVLHQVLVTQVRISFHSSFILVLQEKPPWMIPSPFCFFTKKHAQYKNNAALQRKIVIQALETAIFNQFSRESQFTFLLLKYKLFPSFSKPILAPATEGSRSTFISINTGRAFLHRTFTVSCFIYQKFQVRFQRIFLLLWILADRKYYSSNNPESYRKEKIITRLRYGLRVGKEATAISP